MKPFRFLLAAALALQQLQSVSGSGCDVTLNDDHDPCLSKCMERHGKANYDVFVCDLTKPWLHHYSANPEWLPATPPEGTGKHEYAVYQGDQPPCAGLGRCPGCAEPAAKHLCSVFVDAKDCSITCKIEVSTNNDVTEDFKVDETEFQMQDQAGASSGSYKSTLAALAVLGGAALVI